MSPVAPYGSLLCAYQVRARVVVLSQNFCWFCHVFDENRVARSEGRCLPHSMSPVEVLTLLFFLQGLSFLDLRVVGCLWVQGRGENGNFRFENSSHQKLTRREAVLKRGGSVKEECSMWIFGFL